MSELQASVGSPVSQPAEAEPTAFLLNPGGWVALAMLVVFLLLAWKKVHHALGKALDSKIALIRDQLAEAESLRKEAESLKSEYEARAATADKDGRALLERARHEAGEIVAKAKADAESLVQRRSRMAEDKIAAEERSAVDQLRAAAADAASKAAERLIVTNHDSASDSRIVDEAIGKIVAQ